MQLRRRSNRRIAADTVAAAAYAAAAEGDTAWSAVAAGGKAVKEYPGVKAPEKNSLFVQLLSTNL